MPFGLPFRKPLGFFLSRSHFFSAAGFSSRPLAFLLASRLQLEIQLRGKNEDAIGRKTWPGTNPARDRHAREEKPCQHESGTNPRRIRHESSTNPARIRHEREEKPCRHESATNPARIRHEREEKPRRHESGTNPARIRHEREEKLHPAQIPYGSVKNLARLRRKDRRVAFTYGIGCRRI